MNNKLHKRRASIGLVLALSFGSLVFVAVVAVLLISLYSGLTNTRELLINNSTNQLAGIRRNITGLLDPMENRAMDIAQMIYDGDIDPNDDASFIRALKTALVGANGVVQLGFFYADQRITFIDHKTGAIKQDVFKDNALSNRELKRLKASKTGSWGPLVYVPDLKTTIMTYRQPVNKDGQFIGVVVISIPTSLVSNAVKSSDVGIEAGRFVLYGKDHVLSQEGFQVTATKVTVGEVTPKLSEIDDPILSTIWSAPRTPFRLFKGGDDFDGHFTDVNDRRYQFVYTTLEGYTDEPLYIGYQLPFEDAVKQLTRLASAGLTGLLILVISVFLAFFVGRKIAQPIRSLSQASQQISKLDFSTVGQLSGSRLRELDDAAAAYNTMLRGLTWFENYVPKSLVKKLMISGDAHSETRSVTVMFTDIVNFTPMAESMTSEEVANLLNEHFEILANCIEQQGGTLDKYIGDAVMAFWGAPDFQLDHPVRACRTAIAIRAAIRTENKRREQSGKPPIHIRIGIHTGRLVVGNIGSSGRLNYTVVGDTVNVAQRIEQMGKSLSEGSEEDVVMLVSEQIAKEVKDQIKVEPVGEFAVKGRDTKISLYSLGET